KIYIKHHQQYYDTLADTTLGDVQQKSDLLLYFDNNTNNNSTEQYLRTNYRKISNDIEQSISFKDLYLGITGYYIWKNKFESINTKDNGVTKKISFKYIEFYIVKQSGITSGLKIIKKMTKFVRQLEENNIKLYYVKVLTGASHTVPFY